MQSQAPTHPQPDSMFSYGLYSSSPLGATPSNPYFNDEHSMSDMYNHHPAVAKDPRSAFSFGNDLQSFSNVGSPLIDDYWFPVGDTANYLIDDSQMTTPAFNASSMPMPSPAWSHPTPPLDAAPSSGSSTVSCDSPAPSMRSARRPNPALAPRSPSGARKTRIRSDQSVRSESRQVTASDMAAAAAMPRPTGACSRCKRLKMKCVFSSETPGSCGRCTSGGHECIVEGRKPRTPGLREQLVKKIRKKNEAINALLSQLHCVSATPLSLNPSRLALSEFEREACGDVLDWVERQSARPDKNAPAFDMADLDDEDDMSDSDTDELSSDDMAVDGLKLAPSMPRAHLKPHLYPLPDAAAPIGFLADCSLKYGNDPGVGCVVKEDPDAAEDAHSFGIANDIYFRPSPLADLDLRGIVVAREMIPEILGSGLISADEGRVLFDIFFEKINPFLCILDEAIHTPAAVLKRCPFLFTVVCAVSSRYHPERPALYKMAMHFAKASAASAFIDGWKCIEMVQAYLIMAAYGVPTRRWEEDRSWFYSGVASRLATELDLNRPSKARPSDERYEREMLNRYRTWMICCIIDASICLQLGKQPMIREDAIMQNPSRWCTGSTFQHPFDSGLPNIIELQRIMNRFMEATHTPSSRSTHSMQRVASIVDTFSAQLSASSTSVCLRNNACSQSTDTAENLQTGMAVYFLQYCRLIVFVFGLQAELENDSVDLASSVYLTRCIEAASLITEAWTQKLCTTGLMKYAPDFFFIATGFTGAFLINVLHPRFQRAIGDDQRLHIVSLATSLIQGLMSSGVSVDEQHTPKLYSQFLDGMLLNVMRLWRKRGQTATDAPHSIPAGTAHEKIGLLGQTGEGWQHLRAYLPEMSPAFSPSHLEHPGAHDADMANYMIPRAEQLEDMHHPGITMIQFPSCATDPSFPFHDPTPDFFPSFGN